MSRRKSPVTPTKVKLAVQLATRHRKLSAAISDMRKTNASHTPPAREGPADRLSTRFLTPYCVPTEQARSEEHTSELQSHSDIVCRLLLEKKKTETRCHSMCILRPCQCNRTREVHTNLRRAP